MAILSFYRRGVQKGSSLILALPMESITYSSGMELPQSMCCQEQQPVKTYHGEATGGWLSAHIPPVMPKFMFGTARWRSTSRNMPTMMVGLLGGQMANSPSLQIGTAKTGKFISGMGSHSRMYRIARRMIFLVWYGAKKDN